MISTFDTEKLLVMLKDFYNLTRIQITIFDENYREIVSYPEHIASLCQLIRKNKKGAAACRECDIDACKTAARKRSPYIYQCHAGLTEAITPVYLGNIPIAYLLFGHLFSYPSQQAGWQTIRDTCQQYEINEDHLKEMVMELPNISEDYILSASHIMQAVSSYLCIDRMITMRQQLLFTRIDDWINEHFAENPNAQQICKKFGIGKTYLYELAKKYYGRGIAQQISYLKIEYAKKLLTEDMQMTISEISDRCGFADYNYFITVFKKHTGISPRKYRYTQ